MQSTFTSGEVVALTGISRRQLQWWDEQGIVVPARDCHRRVYSRDDLAEVAIICELRDRGFSLQKIRRIVRFLKKELGKRLVETVSAASEYHLLTDGRHIFLRDSARGVVDLLKNVHQPMLAVCLSETIQRVLSPLEGPATSTPITAAELRAEEPLRQPPVRNLARVAGLQEASARHLTNRGNKAS